MTRGSATTTLYIDGELFGSEVHASPTISTNPYNQINVGRMRGNLGTFGAGQGTILGKMDRLRVWSRILSQSDVLALYHEDADGDGLWDITEFEGRQWIDTNGDAIEQAGEYKYIASPYAHDAADKDHDGDALPSLYEQNVSLTKISNPDTDGDGMLDGWEDENGLDPHDASDASQDPDGDGLTNGEEHVLETNPNNSDTDGDGIGDKDDFPPTWISVKRTLDYDYDDYDPQQFPNAPKWLKTSATWAGAMATNENLNAAIAYNQLDERLATKQPYPANPPKVGLSNNLSVTGTANSIPNPPCHHADLDQRRIYVHVGATSTTPRTFKALKYTQRTINGMESPVDIDVVSVDVPAGSKYSNPLEISPSLNGGLFGNQSYKETVKITIVPIRVSVSSSVMPAEGTFGVNPTIFESGEDLGDPEAFPPNGPKGKAFQLQRKYFTDISGGVLVRLYD